MTLSDGFWLNERNRLLTIIRPRLAQIAYEGVKEASRKAGIAFNPTLANIQAAEYARAHTDDLLIQLETTNKRIVGESLAKYIESGQNIGELHKALTESGFSKERASVIAVTETTRAYASGEQAAYLAEGFTEWTWVAHPDELTCPFCGDAHGKAVRIGASFGDFHGKPVTKPPYHPNCRCTVKAGKKNADKQSPVPQATGAAVPVPVGMSKEQVEAIVRESLSDKFNDLPKDKNLKVSIKIAFQSIDKVLKIPDDAIRSIPITETSHKTHLGGIARNLTTGESVYFVISRKGDHPELTMAHEFGHYIDNDVIGTKGSWSSNLNEVPGWRDAITSSQSYKDLTQLKQTGSVEVNGKPIDIDVGHVNYLLSDHELFARSFAQYISTKSGDTILNEQVKKIRSRPAQDYGARQWSDEDFKPIAEMYDNYFKSIGWIP